MSVQIAPTIDKTKLYGILHELDGTPINRQVRILKIGIGVPTGPDIHVWIDGKNKWCVETGSYENKKRKGSVERFDSRELATAHYIQARKTAPNRLYPRKIPYFTFLRMAVDGNFVHDFDAIEENGPTPTEVSIVFLTDDPFDSRFAWYTAAELKCEGNGLNARRRLALAQGQHEEKLAIDAEAKGEKFFPIVGGCYAKGCMYARGDKPSCKPHGRLHFQLQNSPRVGGTCTFDTTGFRSISQLFSCIEQIKMITGRGDAARGRVAGIPLTMVLRPYKTSHNGQPSTQYGCELRGSCRGPGVACSVAASTLGRLSRGFTSGTVNDHTR